MYPFGRSDSVFSSRTVAMVIVWDGLVGSAVLGDEIQRVSVGAKRATNRP
jgi:hypothetical protein